MLENPSFTRYRSSERLSVGEDFCSGPGYASVARVFRDQLAGKISDMRSLDPGSFVLVPANSMKDGAYLNGVIQPSGVVHVGTELDAVLCADESDFDRLTRFAPTGFPSSTISNSCTQIDVDAGVSPEEQREQMKEFRNKFACALGVSAQDLKLFMGAEEALKAILRVLTEDGTCDLKVKLSLPSYGGWIANAQFFGAVLYQDSDDAPSCDVLYMPLPNNPLGYGTDLNMLRDCLLARDEDTIVLDITSLNLEIDGGRSALSIYREVLWELPKRIVLVDSVSKKLIAASSRVGFLMCNDVSLADEIGKMEPPSLGSLSLSEVLPRFESNDLRNAIRQHALDFTNELHSMAAMLPHDISVYPWSSNFTAVAFSDCRVRERFIEALGAFNWPSVGVRSVMGTPLLGSGLDVRSSEPLPPQGGEILGLRNDCVRLCTLSHPHVLNILRSSVGAQLV